MAMLYHAFSRDLEASSALKVLSSILENGLYLTKESISIDWNDRFGFHKSADVEITQYRVCFTSLSKDEDIKDHSKIFGPIGLGFQLEDIRTMGAFPVFYLPAPTLGDSMSNTDYAGVSLLYRLAEMTSLLEAVCQLPAEYQKRISAKVADLSNLRGSVRFLGNILYLTDYLRPTDDTELRYYKQREWRLIAGLCSEEIDMGKRFFRGNEIYQLNQFQGRPITSFIREVVITGSKNLMNEVRSMLMNRGISAVVRRIA